MLLLLLLKLALLGADSLSLAAALVTVSRGVTHRLADLGTCFVPVQHHPTVRIGATLEEAGPRTDDLLGHTPDDGGSRRLGLLLAVRRHIDAYDDPEAPVSDMIKDGLCV